ncbi:MAG: hypothetical protein IPO21_00665 [Bacteroidales bacterium]|nr:hypothetical protein [Bacteroidales bacterium]
MNVKSDIKRIFIIISIIVSSIQMNFGQSNDFESEVNQIIKEFKSRDTALINQCIHPKFGMVAIYCKGMMSINGLVRLHEYVFDKNQKELYDYEDFEIDSTFQYEENPVFDCDSGLWNKTGLFCDKKYRDNLLSHSTYKLVDFGVENNYINSDIIKEYEKIEKKSIKIFLVDNSGGKFIFYVSKYKGKWYVTIIDEVARYCGE